MALTPQEEAELERAREARAYRRLTLIAALGALAVTSTGAYLLGRGHRESTVLRDDYRPPAPVTVYCGREGTEP